MRGAIFGLRVVLLLVVALGVMPAVALGDGWVVQKAPRSYKGGKISLNGVSCASVDACVAVGSNPVAVAERWDGKHWAIQPTPVPPGTQDSSGLYGVSCASVNACVAVGRSGGDPVVPLVERWDGKRWTLPPTPVPPGAGFSELDSVSCASASACVAVGTSLNVSATQQTPLVERWDGKSWTLEATPVPPGPSDDYGLVGVSCPSADACVALGMPVELSGRSLVERWDGTSWTVQPSPKLNPFTALSGVSCASASACVAVGTSGEYPDFHTVPVVERWDGNHWAMQRMPHPAAIWELNAVACVSADACTAVGDDTNSIASALLPMVERWDGTSWTVQSSPKLNSYTSLTAVSCASASACTAVSDWGFIESWTPGNNKFTVSRLKAAADGTLSLSVRVPQPGSVEVLATASKDHRRLVFAREHKLVARRRTVIVTPSREGRLLLADPRHRFVLRLWVSYTPRGGRPRMIGFLGLHLPGSCKKHNSVTALDARTVVRCN